MVKSKSNMMWVAVIALLAVVGIGGFYFMSRQTAVIEDNPAGCNIAPSLLPNTYDYDNKGTAAPCSNAFWQNGNKLGTALSGAAFSTGLQVGEVTIMYCNNQSELTTASYPSVGTFDVACGAQTAPSEFVKQKYNLSVANVINNDGLTANADTVAARQDIGSEGSATLNMVLQGVSKKWFGDCGALVVFNLNTTQWSLPDTTFEGMNAVEADTPSVHAVSVAGQQAKAFQIDPTHGSSLQDLYVTFQAKDLMDPENTTITYTMYDMQGVFENAKTGQIETGCFVEDEADADLGLDTVTGSIYIK